MDLVCKKKLSSLLTWVNSFETDEKVDNLSQLSSGLVLTQCITLLGFQPDNCINQPPLEFVVSRLSDFYCCDLTKCGVLELSKISVGKEEEIAKVLVLLLCMAVKQSENENFIETILSLPNDVQFDLKYFIETTMEQIDNGNLSSGDFALGGCDGRYSVTNTPSCTSSKCYAPMTSPALQNWLCSPYTTDDATTPKLVSQQLFECLEVKELKHKLRLMEKDLEIQHSLVTDYEGEIERLSEERSDLIVDVAEKDENIRQLRDKCEELENLEDVEMKLQKAEEEIKNLKQQLELIQEEESNRSELQQNITDQHKELKELNQTKNLLQVKLLKYQHQVQELELECKSQHAQCARSVKQCNEAMQKIKLLEKQNSDLQDDLTREKEVLAETFDQNTLLQQQNSTLSNELALLQEQYANAMCTVGSEAQEKERLQQLMRDMEERYTSELNVKDQQLKILHEQVTDLTTRVEKLLIDCELQAKEHDEKEAQLRVEWQERISLHEQRSSSQASKAEQMAKSYQLTISNLTRERDEGRAMANDQLNTLEATYKEKVDRLECEISNCKEAAEQKMAQFKQQELQLKESLQQCHGTITVLEQKLSSAETDCAEAKKQYQWELDKLNGEHQLEILQLSQQLEEVSSKQKILVHENEELKGMMGKKEAEYEKMHKKQEEDYLNICKQCEKLTGESNMLMSNLKQNQAIAKQQTEMMAKELEQVCNEKLKILAEYQAYSSVMKQKEVGLLDEVKELRQQKEMALYKEEQLTGQVKQYQETVTILEQKLSSSLASYAEAEQQHRQEIQQQLVDLDKLNDEHKLKVMQLSQQLEMTNKEYEAFKSQHIQESKELANKELEYAELRDMFNKQEKDYSNALLQLEKLAEDKDKLLVDLKQSQLVAKQQVEQVHHEQEMMSKELEQLSTKYQAYQSVMQEKEIDLLHEVAEMKQQKDVALKKLEDSLEKLALMEDKQNKLSLQVDNMENEHRVEVESYQAAIDKGLSANSELEMKNKFLLQELNSVKEKVLVLTERLQSFVDTESISLWKQQVKQLEDNLCEVKEQLSAKDLSLQQSKEHCKTLASLLEQKKEEFVQLETSYWAQSKNTATLIENKECRITLLQSQLANEQQQSKMELEAIRNENERLLKSVDQLYSQQSATSSQLEQDCLKKFSALEQSNIDRLEEIARMQVEMTSLLNELQVLRLNHKESTESLSVEREKNSSLENEAKQLKATIKAFEKENARVYQLMLQPKHTAVRLTEDEHLQELHSEMDQQCSGHVMPLQLAKDDDNANGSRLEELRARNSFRPPHLKSCYPVELQLQCGTPRSSQVQELQMKGALHKKTGYFEVSPPHKRNMAHRQLLDSPDGVKRRLSAPPTPISTQSSVAHRMTLRSYLNDEQDENKPPLSRPSDAFEISLSSTEQSTVKMAERKSKMFQRMAATRKTQSRRSTAAVTKPLHVRNASKKK